MRTTDFENNGIGHGGGTIEDRDTKLTLDKFATMATFRKTRQKSPFSTVKQVKPIADLK